MSVPDTQTKVHLALAARAQQATVPMMDLSAQGHGQTARLRNSHCAATATTGERATLNCRVPASAKPIMVTVPMNMQIAMNFAVWSSLAGFEPRLPAYEADALPLKLLRLKFSNTRRGHSYFCGNGDRRRRIADITWILQLDRWIDAARRLCQSRSTVRLLGSEKAPTA